MFNYINEDTPKENINNCKTLTQKIRVYCVESIEFKPEGLLERNRILNALTLGWGNRYPLHEEDIIISAETVLKLQEVKKNIQNDFKILYPKCDIVMRDI